MWTAAGAAERGGAEWSGVVVALTISLCTVSWSDLIPYSWLGRWQQSRYAPAFGGIRCR